MIVAIETSAEVGGVALVEGGEVLAERVLGPDDQPAGLLLPALDALLTKTGRILTEDVPLALSIGPGSFTGLRIGLATALGICFGTSRRLVPVPTLAALSLRAGDEERIVPLLDARKGQVYGGVYAPDARRLHADRVTDPLPFLRLLVGGPPPVFLGPGAQVYRAQIQEVFGPEARVLAPEVGWPRASCVGLLGERLALEPPGCAPEQVEPLYLRPSQAEEGRPAAFLDTPSRNS